MLVEVVAAPAALPFPDPIKVLRHCVRDSSLQEARTQASGSPNDLRVRRSRRDELRQRVDGWSGGNATTSDRFLVMGPDRVPTYETLHRLMARIPVLPVPIDRLRCRLVPGRLRRRRLLLVG